MIALEADLAHGSLHAGARILWTDQEHRLWPQWRLVSYALISRAMAATNPSTSSAVVSQEHIHRTSPVASSHS